MKITAIRIRVLRSRSVGYGHDAAEIEAQLEPGDDAAAVAAELRAMCETEVRQGAACDRIRDTLESLMECEVRTRAELKRVQNAIVACEDFITAAREKGVDVPQVLAEVDLPF